MFIFYKIFSRLKGIFPTYKLGSISNSKYYSSQSRRYSSGYNTKKQLLSLPEKLFEKIEDLDPSSILDIGCGEAEELRYLSSKLGLKGIGIEPSKVAINKLKRKYPNLRFLKGSATNIKMDDNTSDLVIISSVLHWIEPNDYLVAISEACRVAKKNLLIMDFYNFEPVSSPNKHHKGRLTYRRDFVGPVLGTGEFKIIFQCFYTKSQNGIPKWNILRDVDVLEVQTSKVDIELRRAVIFEKTPIKFFI